MIPAHELLGQGPPLALIPGTFADRRAWVMQLGALTPRHQVLLYDPRGTGQTPDPGVEFSVDDLVADLFELVESLGIGRLHLIGHSLGAAVALLAAARRPDLVDRVVAIAPAVTEDAYLHHILDTWEALAGSDLDDHALHQALVAQAFGRGAFDWLVPRVVAEMDRTPLARDTIQRYARCDRRLDLGPEPKQIDAQVLVVAGAEDALTGVEQARAVAAAVPSGRLEVVAGAGHSPQLEQAATVDRLLVDFLKP